MKVSDYIKQLQSYEQYAFSWEELLKNSNAPESTLIKELSRLAKKNEIINLRKGFYLIIPPRYNNLRKIPLQLYIDKLFKYLNKPYYVGLYSASTFYGASHQQTQKDYIITTTPALRDIKKENILLHFINISKWSKLNIIERKSDAGFFNISSPALTAVDLIHYHLKIGGLNRTLANLEELAEEITEKDLSNLLSWYSNKSTLQRFGFLLEELQIDKNKADLIFNKLKEDTFYPTLLSPKKEQKAGSAKNRWKIDVNLKIESDL